MKIIPNLDEDPRHKEIRGSVGIHIPGTSRNILVTSFTSPGHHIVCQIMN
jgi:hypothetical protein